MDRYIRIPLRTERGRRLYYDQIRVTNLKKDIEIFLSIENSLSNISVKDILNLTDYNRKERNNVLKSYEYILNQRDINKDTLKKLYDIRSDKLLDIYSEKNMGKYYREGEVFILKNGSILDCIECMDYNKINEFMDRLFLFIQNSKSEDIENFIDSQIIHFYLYYIHPYFDLNKRTSRMLASWNLINNKNYNYLLIENGLSFNRSKYQRSLYNSRKGNVTDFIELSLSSVQKEMEIHSIINSIKKYRNLSSEQMYMIKIMLNITNSKDIIKLIDRSSLKILKQLLDKNIIIEKNNMNKKLYLNRQLIELDDDVYKKVKIKKISK
ncbi:MAG: Fic family protein [Bacilli bacterium]|nr:Fic family protein [Bacilli bacterium]